MNANTGITPLPRIQENRVVEYRTKNTASGVMKELNIKRKDNNKGE